jgi:hypothetical protein
MTSGEVIGLHREQIWSLDVAETGFEVETTGMEATAGRNRAEVGTIHAAEQQLGLPASQIGVWFGNSGEQGLRVRVTRFGEQPRCGRNFNQTTQIHNRDLSGPSEILGHGQVMSDEQERDTELVAKFF